MPCLILKYSGLQVLLVLWAMLAMTSCDSSPTVIPNAENAVSGNVDGTSFAATNVSAILDTTGIYIISATINSDAQLSLYFKDGQVENHDVQTSGAFREFLDQLDSLIALDPPIEDSLILDSLATGLAELLAGDDDPLGDDKCFLFYVIGDFIYYSETGNFQLTEFDEELNRLSGELNIGLINFSEGRKDLNALLNDIQVIE